MPLPKVRTGRLAPDQEALDYYDTEVKHWTPNSWDQIDMDRLDIGFHTDPTVGGTQALDRKMSTKLQSGLGANEMRDMRIHLGNELESMDAGLWDVPEEARRTISNALADHDWELGELFEEEFWPRSMTRESTLTGNKDAIEDTSRMRQWLLDNGFDTISYKNREEGVDAAVDAAMNDESFIKWQTEHKEKIKDLEMQAAEAGRRGDEALEEELDLQANALDDELQYTRNDRQMQARANNISHISLNPGNVRSADANFQRDMIGKPDMRGSATVPTMAGSAALGAIGTLAQNEGVLGVGAAALDTANRFGETLVNDLLTGSQMLSNAIYDTSDTAPQVDFAPSTGAGDTFVDGLVDDFGRAMNYGGILGGPTGMELLNKGIGAYNEYVKPLLSERQEEGLGGAALLAGVLGLPSRRAGSAAIPDDYSASVSDSKPRVGDVPKLAETSSTVIPRTDLQQEIPLKLEDLEGQPFLTTFYDRAGSGTLTEINDVPLERPVTLDAGYDYMRGVEPGNVTASGGGVPAQMRNLSEYLRDKTGMDPLYIPHGMGPKGSDFNAMQPAAMIEYARANMGLDDFNDVANGVRDHFNLNIHDDYLGNLKEMGGRRKGLQNYLDSYRNRGGLSMGEARLATQDSRQWFDDKSQTPALNIGRLHEGPIGPSNHSTYPKAVPGEYVGTLAPEDRFSVLALDPVRLSGLNEGGFNYPGLATERGVNLDMPTHDDVRALQMAPAGGILDERRIQQALDLRSRVSTILGQ